MADDSCAPGSLDRSPKVAGQGRHGDDLTTSGGAAGAATSAADRRFSTEAIFVMVVTLGWAYAFNGMDRAIFPALLPAINSEYSLSVAQGGFLSNVFTLNIAIFGALGGWFMGRFGRKRTLVGGLIAYSLFTFLIPLARTYAEITFLRAMTGAGEALHIAAVFSMLGAYFGPRRGTFIGINNAFFGLGSFLGPFLGTQLFEALHSWRAAFYVCGIAGVVAAGAVALLVPRAFSEAVDDEAPIPGLEDRCPEKVINANSMLCAAAFFLTGYSFLAYSALYSLYLREALGFTIAEAGAAFSLFGIGALTALVGGWLGEKLGRYGLPLCLSIMACCGFLMFNGPGALIAQMALSFVFGAMLSGFLYPRFLAVAQRSVRPHHIGFVMSLMIPIFYIAGFIAGPTFGSLVPLLGWATAGTLSVTVTALAAAALVCFIQPSKMRGGLATARAATAR